MVELRHGLASSQGPRSYQEDLTLVVTDLAERLKAAKTMAGNAGGEEKGGAEKKEEEAVDLSNLPSPSAFYGVFDGHCGICAATFARNRLLDNIVSHEHFPETPIEVLREACLKTDAEFEEACTSLPEEASGTTALAMLVLGEKIVVANIGDSRAVLSRKGQAMGLSQDQKPHLFSEWERIQKAGGYIDGEGFLNGKLAVSRAIGDWHFDDMKKNKDGTPGPLIADPDINVHLCQAEDEFVLLASDGLWDVFSSQGAVTFARDRLREHNDPVECSKELIEEAINRHTTDNISCVCVCLSAAKPPELKKQKGNGMPRTLSSSAVHDLKKALTDVENVQGDFNNLGISSSGNNSFTSGQPANDRIPENKPL
ncbi:protein phosphatase 2C [Chloropicon primus]|uniref:Protein phosphatase 2C n=1 Tax=Chloropicon primus TaxID=1764295 RepID=A0A5B8MW38_9CHLO|nr:protein phosphatase 2C [Chloropicon primus]UPR03048.1 protein phosphatase 2C [Chloropicon primus]|eukprot:QDZ23835.1 protein phosphatase 2C [Chloropicon primus]